MLGYIIVLTGFFTQGLCQQTIDKAFGGWWASTSWWYEFHGNGTYHWKSSGHYGYVKRTGRYRMSGDTIHILSGNGNTHGTLGEYYILDKDSMLIDLETRYDYMPVGNEPLIYSSKIRNVKYPQVASRNPQQEKDLEEVLRVLLNDPALKKYYHFDQVPSRQLLVAGYFSLDDNTRWQVSVDGKPLIFLPKEQIRDPFYILIEDINLSVSVTTIRLGIPGEGISVSAYFQKMDGNWVLTDTPYIYEQ